MRVLLEGTQAVRRHKGWGRYTLELVRALAAVGPALELHVFYNCRPGEDDAELRRALPGGVHFHALALSDSEYTQREEDFTRSFLDEAFPQVDVYHAVTEFPWLTERARLV